MGGHLVRHVFRLAQPLAHESARALIPTWNAAGRSSAAPMSAGFQIAEPLDRALVDRGVLETAPSEQTGQSAGFGMTEGGSSLPSKDVTLPSFESDAIFEAALIGWWG